MREKSHEGAVLGGDTVRLEPLQLAHEEPWLGAQTRAQLFLGQSTPQRVLTMKRAEHLGHLARDALPTWRRDDERFAVHTMRRAVGRAAEHEHLVGCLEAANRRANISRWQASPRGQAVDVGRLAG